MAARVNASQHSYETAAVALAAILADVEPGSSITSVLVGTRTPDGEDIYLYTVAGEPGVRSVLLLKDSPAYHRAASELAGAAVSLDVPEEP